MKHLTYEATQGLKVREAEIDKQVAAGLTKRLTYGEKRRRGLVMAPKKPKG